MNVTKLLQRDPFEGHPLKPFRRIYTMDKGIDIQAVAPTRMRIILKKTRMRAH